MKQNIRTYSLILICTLLIVACKKYPEGGYEKDGPKNIIGTWWNCKKKVDKNLLALGRIF